MMVEWGRYQDAFKAIWEKLEEIAKALDSKAQDSLRVKTV